jgi:hypothetical protein
MEDVEISNLRPPIHNEPAQCEGRDVGEADCWRGGTA